MKYIKLKNEEIVNLSDYEDFEIASDNGIILHKNNISYYISEEEIEDYGM